MNKQQLANKIWASANKMRSKIEANEYKDYILGLVFYKFLSDNEVKALDWSADELKELREDYDDPDMAETVNYCKKNIGYFIEYKNLFSTWLLPDGEFSVAVLSDALKAFDRLVPEKYKPVYGGIFKTLQEGLSKLGENPSAQTKSLKALIRLIKDIPTDGSEDYDVLGFVYEYLISNFAANAGKKAGEFYTPHEVAMLMSEIVADHHRGKERIEIYDPTSGSGSLLITIGKAMAKYLGRKDSVKYYAQELKENTYNLTRMNLVMRGIKPDSICTRCADSLEEDWPKVGSYNEPLRVDAVVSNPPYSQHWDPRDKEYDGRFQNYGVAPKSKADYAFLLHELHHLNPDGILTIVLPHGVLFRGNPDDGSEGMIRKNLIEKNHIDAVIGLPANIFFGTGIPTLVMVLKQHRGAEDDDVLIIDASKGFVKEGKNNRLRACDIRRIADTVRERRDVPGYSRRVSREEIRQNGYNLNIPRYVDSSEAAEQWDVYATVFGGIPESEIDSMRGYWEALPSLCGELFARDEEKPYSRLLTEDVARAVNANADVAALRREFAGRFSDFGDVLHERLINNVMSVREATELDSIAADIFRRFEGIRLVDRYDAYQVLSDCWQVIAADIEVIQTEGWEAVRVVETAYKMVKKDDEETEVAAGLKGRIIPFGLIQAEKFAGLLEDIAAKEAHVEEIASEIDETIESFDEDEVNEYFDDKDEPKIDKKRVKAGAKAKGDEVEPETKGKLKRLVRLWDEQTKANRDVKTARAELEDKTVAAIKSLSDGDAAMLLHKKWVDPICCGISALMEASLESLTKSVCALAKKYASPYSEITAGIASAHEEFAALVGQLTGDEFALEGLRNL